MKQAHKHFGAEDVVVGEKPHVTADMNVTPLIDVLLVLLVIFMTVQISDLKHLEKVMKSLKSVEGVLGVERSVR